MRFVGLAVLVSYALVPAAHAQEQVAPVFEIGTAIVDGPVPVAGNATLIVPWTYEFPTPAGPPAGSASITWTVDCPDVVATGTTEATTVAFVPGQSAYGGTAEFGLRATAEAPGLEVLLCTVAGTAAGPTETMQSSDDAEFQPVIAYVGGAEVVTPNPSGRSGPQKVIPYEMMITSFSNARTLVTFEVVDEPGGRWNVILPDALILDGVNSGGGKTSATAVVRVMTPYHNGYVKDSSDLVVRIRTAAADEPELAGPSFNVTLEGKAQGLYIPGPSPMVVVAALLVLAAARRA